MCPVSLSLSPTVGRRLILSAALRTPERVTAGDDVVLPARTTPRLDGCAGSVYVSPHNPGAAEVAALLSQAAGVDLATSDASAAVCHLLLLDERTHARSRDEGIAASGATSGVAVSSPFSSMG